MKPDRRPVEDPGPGNTGSASSGTPIVDAIVLAGGRSSRLGGTPKQGLRLNDRSLLDSTLDAVADVRLRVLVGDDANHGPDVLRAREEPAFGGPAAGIGAGVARLAESAEQASDYTVVLACDMPAVAEALECLRQALGQNRQADGFIAVAENGRLQPLVAIYATGALTRAVAEANRGAGLSGASVFDLISGLDLLEVSVPPGSTDDVDTWQDAARLGIEHAGLRPTQ